MAVSNKFVVFALLGLSFVAVNYVVANKDASFDLACQSIGENDSLFKLREMSSSHTVSPDSVHLKSVKSKSLQISDSSECINDADNNVSWMDWVFSWQDSPTFHYLDLLELLTPVESRDSAHSHRVKP